MSLNSLSIVVPAYNEEKRLPAALQSIMEWVAGRSWTFVEVVVVDDGSADRTGPIVEDFARAHPCVRLLRSPENRGKGSAVRQGMLSALGDWILYSDADLSTPIAEVDRLCRAAARERARIAIGSRALDRALVSVHQPALREYSGRFFNLVMRLITGLGFADTQCGFKLYEAGAARQVFSRQILDGFSFDVEDLYIARLCGIPAVEVPVRWANVEGSKVRLSQGLWSFADLVAIRRNRARGRYKC